MIFGGSSHHGRPADVDHFEEIIVVQRRRGGGGVPERVEVAGHDANGGVTETTEFSCVGFLVKTGQQRTVNGGVE